MNFPIVKLTDIPVSTATPDADTTLPAVLGNATTVRLRWSDLLDGVVFSYTTPPSSPNSPGENGSISISSSGLYVYANGAWNKVFIYSDNWDEITTDTRALLVNAPMTLTQTEIENVKTSINLTIANQDYPGLVKFMTQEEQNACPGTPVIYNADGTFYTPLATGTTSGTVTVWDGTNGLVPTKDWVESYINNIPEVQLSPATTTKLGGVLSDAEDGLFAVTTTGQVQIRTATTSAYGVTKLAESISAGSSGVPTAGQVYTFITENLEDLYGAATYTKSGLVRPNRDGCWGDANSPSTGLSNVGPLYLRDGQGMLDIYPASSTVPGVVLCVTNIPSGSSSLSYNYPSVPTVDAVRTFVNNSVANMVVTIELPYPSSTEAGAVLPDSSLFTVDYDTGFLTINDASSSKRGVVLLAASISDSTTTYDTSVPTVGQIKTYVTSKLSALTSQISSLQTQVQALNNTLSALQQSVSNLEGRVSALEQKLPS